MEQHMNIHNKHLKKRIISFILAVFIIVGAFQITPIAARASEGYSIRINYETNTITVYLDGKPVKGFICSTGAATPTGGTYYTQEKFRWAELKGGDSMPRSSQEIFSSIQFLVLSRIRRLSSTGSMTSLEQQHLQDV